MDILKSYVIACTALPLFSFSFCISSICSNLFDSGCFASLALGRADFADLRTVAGSISRSSSLSSTHVLPNGSCYTFSSAISSTKSSMSNLSTSPSFSFYWPPDSTLSLDGSGFNDFSFDSLPTSPSSDSFSCAIDCSRMEGASVIECVIVGFLRKTSLSQTPSKSFFKFLISPNACCKATSVVSFCCFADSRS